MSGQPIELYYWPGLPGRGEFIRLVLEDAGVPYVDVARGDEKNGQGVPALMKYIEGKADTKTPPLAPPFIKDGDRVIGQTAAVLFYLGPKAGLAPKDEGDRLWAHQLQLTITDLVEEVHSTHHPVDKGGWYKDQRPESIRFAEHFCKDRMPKFLKYFERVLSKSSSAYLVGDSVSYVDISIFYVVQGLRFAFPKASERVLKETPKVLALYETIGARPNIKKYLESDRRMPFGNGIFRKEAELDF